MAKKQDKDNETTLPADVVSDGALPVIPPGDVVGTEQTADSEGEFARLLEVPDGDVLIRRLRGIDGVHAIGSVKRGRLYTVSLAEATACCLGDQPEFEPVFKADRTRIEGEASRAAERQAKRAALESELSRLQ